MEGPKAKGVLLTHSYDPLPVISTEITPFIECIIDIIP